MTRSAGFIAGIYRRRDLRNLFALALVLRLLLLWEAVHQVGLEKVALVSSDANCYLEIARSFLNETPSAEKCLFTFGPGYGLFLASILKVFGNHYLPLVLTNILISSFSCLFVYKLGKFLTGSYAVGIVAGLISATSYTSITLSNTLLSDTTYFFVFTGGLLLYLQSLETPKWQTSLIAGLIFGVATLTRAVNQFWPISMVAIALAHEQLSMRPEPGQASITRAQRLARVVICLIIVLSITGAWVVRNYATHGVSVVTGSGIQGFSKIAQLTVARIENKSEQEVRQEWVLEYRAKIGKNELTVAEQYQMLRERSLAVARLHPSGLLRTYGHWTWRNITEISMFHRNLVPEFNSVLIPLEGKIKRFKLNYLCFVLSLLGCTFLIMRKRFYPVIVLVAVYVYFAALVGLTQYQGSRPFYPAQTSWSVLIAYAIVVFWNSATNGIRRLVRRIKI